MQSAGGRAPPMAQLRGRAQEFKFKATAAGGDAFGVAFTVRTTAIGSRTRALCTGGRSRAQCVLWSGYPSVLRLRLLSRVNLAESACIASGPKLMVHLFWWNACNWLLQKCSVIPEYSKDSDACHVGDLQGFFKADKAVFIGGVVCMQMG